MTWRGRALPARLAPVLVGVSLATAATQACAQQVYIGTADQWHDLVAKPEQWSFVRAQADGLYVNFIMMKHLTDHLLEQTASLLHSRRAFFESDDRPPKPGDVASGASPQDDRSAIAALHAAGFTIPYTSLNYGWDRDRAVNLSGFDPKEPERRKNFVQFGPWGVGGDLEADRPRPDGARSGNAGLRDLVGKADGISTDGPMGLWKADRGHMQGGSASAVLFAHRTHKAAVVMLSPYGAGNADYDPSQFLSVAQDAVHRHEDAGASPDIWTVFEYATAIAAVPEQQNGRAASTTTGVAYWLLHHLRDPDHSLALAFPHGGWRAGTDGSRSLNAVVSNSSAWVDFAPRLRVAGAGDVRVTVDGHAMPERPGDEVALTGAFRLGPGQSRSIRIVDLPRRHAQTAEAARLELFPAPGPGGTPRVFAVPSG